MQIDLMQFTPNSHCIMQRILATYCTTHRLPAAQIFAEPEAIENENMPL